jgi:hypothetical protein
VVVGQDVCERRLPAIFGTAGQEARWAAKRGKQSGGEAVME